MAAAINRHSCNRRNSGIQRLSGTRYRHRRIRYRGGKEIPARKSPTYLYDGIPDQVNTGSLVSLGDRGWEVTLIFTSRTAGYGDRSGQMTAQVLTNHSIRIVVAPDGLITSAVMDSFWNKLSQKQL